MLQKVRRLVAFVGKSGGIKALRWKPPSLASFEQVSALSKIEPNIRTVIDGGANVGQFARASVELYPNTQVYSFEPLAEPANKFRKNLSACSRVRLIESALGDFDGTTKFYPNAYSQLSSIHPFPENHQPKCSQDKQLDPTEVPITRIDTFFSKIDIQRPALLKLDLQGHELAALDGATETLKRVDYVLMEVVFARLYENTPLFNDLVNYMKSVNYAFAAPLAIARDAQGLFAEMDALFSRIELS